MHDESLGRRAHAVLMAALDHDGPDRSAFLAEACAGDVELRGCVNELAAALTRSTTFMERPAFDPRPAVLSAATPATIGGYQVLRVLGAGGMATVYEAEQEQPRRRVALKVMRRGLLETSAVHRFRFETEVLARLQHPGIAQIYEAGTFSDSDGRTTPFFAMEYVSEAQTLTEFARRGQLSLHARLRLFLHVCDAVHHGHQLGVIHRDLKPANILVDRAGRPKVIDFGVARSSDAEQAWITRDSDLGSFVGTLHYMSPEQCTAGAAVDLRSDVYALGVVLYELIAGRAPHDLRELPLPQALRIIAEGQPPPLATVAPEARGDLSAIVGMALEKEQRRRYPGVDALAADLRRYLSDQPIEARPATTLYQLRKFARRNRPVVIGVAAVLLTLTAGIVSTSRMAWVARQAQRAAEAREDDLAQMVAFQHAQLSQVDVAEMGNQMRAALAAALTAASAPPGAAPPDGAVAAPVLQRINFTTLAARMLDDTILQRSHAALRTQFESQPLLRAKLLQRLALTMNVLGLPDRAALVAAEALELRRGSLGSDHVDALESQHLHAVALKGQGRYRDAVSVLNDLLERSTRTLGADDERTLATASSLGGALRLTGDLAGADRIWTQTLAVQRRALGEDHPATLRTLHNLGTVYADSGLLDAAEACWREVLERRRRQLGPDHPDVRGSVGNLGLLLAEQGKLVEARRLLEEDLAASRRQFGDQHPTTLASQFNLGANYIESGQHTAAEDLLRACLDGRRQLFGDGHPATWRTMGALAEACRAGGCPSDAEPLLQAALAAQRNAMGAGHPDTLRSMLSLSAVHGAQNEPRAAEALALEAITTATLDSTAPAPLLAECFLHYGRALAALGRADDAAEALSEAKEILVLVRGPAHPLVRTIERDFAELATRNAPP